MHSRFDEFRATPLGQQLEALIDAPGRYGEYAALSRAGVPAVAAVVHDLQSRFPEVTANHTARQFCGAMVADVMRRHHHEILRPRGRVPGDLLTYGAVWTPLPEVMPFPALLEALRRMPEEIATLYARIPGGRSCQRPPGSGLAAAEHLCHLRDLDEVYRTRLERILSEDLPHLPSVNGQVLADERNYRAQDPMQALQAFREGRQALVTRLEATTPEQRCRIGLRDSVRRVTLLEVVEDIHHHDQTHVQELHDLLEDLSDLPELQDLRVSQENGMA